MADITEDILDLHGDWEIRVTIYRNGRRIGTCDTTAWERYEDAAYWAGEGLSTRDIDFHQPRPRRTTHPPTPAASEGETNP